MSITGVNHITLVVSDLAKSVAFYQSALGAKVAARSDRMAYLELGALWLCLESGHPDVSGDASHIALTCSDDDFSRLSQQINASGARIWKDNRSEGLSLYFQDPDGRKLELHVGDLFSRLAHYRAYPGKGITVHK